MNFELSSANLHELEQLVTALLADSKCACHIINPHKTRILMWTKIKDGQTTYHLRIGIQKFISQEQIDRNGEIYWRYYPPELKEEEVNKELPTPSEKLDPITKFNQQQAQAQNGKATNTEPAVDHSQSS